MYSVKIIAAALCALVMQPLHLARAGSEPEFVEVSLVSLIATPERFDGKPVLIQGIAYSDDKASIYAVYLTQDDKRAGNDKNAIYLILAPSLGKMGHLNDSYVMARGVFRAEMKGHLGAFAGSLENVDLIRGIKRDVK